MVRPLDVFLCGFGKVMSKRVHLKLLYFYILWHFTLTRELGVTKEDVRGVGGSIHLVSYLLLCPMVEFGLKHIYLIFDLNNDLFNDLMT